MNFTRQKRLFLLIFALAGMCPAIYCADHEEPAVFESNIRLPLQGEEIGNNDIEIDRQYANLLPVVTSAAVAIPVLVAAYRSLLPSLIKQDTFWLPSIVTRGIPYINKSLIVFAFGMLFSHLVHKIYYVVRDRSYHAMWESWYLLNQARVQHNRAVSSDPQYEGMIVTDGQENRTLLTRHDNEVGHYPFDMWRRNRQAAMRSGLVNKILLGYRRLACIRAINKRLDVLDDQLRPLRNIKRSQ